jgi:hypothetical protein
MTLASKLRGLPVERVVHYRQLFESREHRVPTGQAIGSAGELVAQARLILRGWIVGNVNEGGMMNAPSVDLFAAKGKRTIRLAVKATGHSNSDVQWSVKFGWSTLFKGETRRSRCQKSSRILAHAKKRDGSPRKKGNHISIGWLGRDTTGNISRGFQEK